MIVVVSGSRDYVGGEMMRLLLDGLLLQHKQDLKIFQGGAAGADSLAAAWASDNAVICRTFRADWDTHGKAAGPIRNEEMLRGALVDAAYDTDRVMLLAFKDGVDRTLNNGGTEHACLVARQLGIPVTIIERLTDDYADHPRNSAYAGSQDRLF